MTIRMIAALTALAPVALAATIPATAHAAQFQAGADIFTGTGVAARYAGAGGNVQPSNRALGSIADGGFDTFDNFGFYNSGVGGLTLTRQVELLSGNVYRFFDTFTNGTATTISTTVNFFGNLGSDGDELVTSADRGLIVTCQDDGMGACGEDAVLALVAGNNGLAQAAVTPDRYNARFALTVGAGQSVSLLNFAFLARDEAGPLDSDVALASRTGAALLDAPPVEGLSRAQIATVANFTIASMVPEPASWGMMMLGFGAIGTMLRCRRRTPRALA